jgi:hypothetical protein
LITDFQISFQEAKHDVSFLYSAVNVMVPGKKLEMVQSRAARYATNRYRNTSSVTDMLENLEWETLESGRTTIQLEMFFKIINDLVDIPSSRSR